MLYFAFVDTNAVLVRKIDKSYVNIKKRLPCVKGGFFYRPEGNWTNFH